MIHLIGDINAEIFGDLALNAEIGLNRVVVLVIRVQIEEHAARRPGRRRGSQTVDLGLGQDTKRIRTCRYVASGVSVDAILIQGGNAV